MTLFDLPERYISKAEAQRQTPAITWNITQVGFLPYLQRVVKHRQRCDNIQDMIHRISLQWRRKERDVITFMV